MLRAQSGPDSNYLYVVTPKPKIARRSRRAGHFDSANSETANLESVSPLVAEEDRRGSVPKALLIAIPISALLWALIVVAALHVL